MLKERWRKSAGICGRVLFRLLKILREKSGKERRRRKISS
jgi:hypothetical protein